MRVLTVAAIALLAAPRASAQDKPEVIVELDRDRIYEGESVRYSVTLNNVQNPTEPRLPRSDAYDFAFLDHRDSNFQQTIVINGRRRDIVRRGRTYNYRLTPHRSGRLQIPAPFADVDGKAIPGQTVAIEVIAPTNQDLAILQISADRTSVYPMQPFTIVLTIAVKELAGAPGYGGPIESLVRPPALSIPWAIDERLDEGLKPETEWRQWLGAMRSNAGGFSVNNIGEDSVFSFFADRLTVFSPPSRQSRRPDKTGEETDYREYIFRRTFNAAKVGQYTFGPATLKGLLARDLERGEDVYAVARPVVVTVKDVPAQGRPDSYIGAVGSFQATANLAPQRARVGDPMTLTLSIRGRGVLDQAVPPDLQRLPQIAQQFKVYEATTETVEGERRFTYGLRPMKAGIESFPGLPISYFDVDQEKYVTLLTKPIPIEVSQADQLSDKEIALAGAPRKAYKDVEVLREGIYANMTDMSALRDQSVRPGRWFLSFGAMGWLFVLVVAVKRRMGRRGGDKQWRRRAAAGKARRRLQEALTEIDTQNARDAAEHLGSALVGLVADVAGVSETGLTAPEAQKRLEELAVDGQVVQRLANLLDACDRARYGASESALHGLADESQAVLDTLLKALKAKRLLR